MTARVTNPSAAHSGSGLLQSPSLLLVVTGTLIGFNFPLGKIAGTAGVSPTIWAMIVSLGACLALLPVLAFRGHLRLPRGRMLRYAVISGVISYIAPNLLLFTVIPHVGAGYAGLMFALSPVFTLAIATISGLKAPGRLGIAGIALGLAGAVIVSITRGSAPEAPSFIWIVAALAVPLTLASGNVYRTLDWPKDASPDALAFWSHAFSVLVFLGILLMTTGGLPLGELALTPTAAVTQMIVAGMTFPAFFRLQQKGGPVLLSQIGYVAAAVGLIAATALLGESYAVKTWIGAGVIALGIAVAITAQIRGKKQ